MARVNINLDSLRLEYFTFDKPILWKGLKIYPILVEDWLYFSNYADILQLEKNDTDSVEVIQMNYLKWLLIMAITNEEMKIMPKLYKILELTFKAKNITFGFYDSEGNEVDETQIGVTNPRITIDEVVINHRDFDELRSIIMFQNLPYYDDTYINPSVKKAIEEYEKMKSKDIESPSFERQIVIVANERGMKEKEIYEMTYRKFNMALSELTNKLEYQINKSAEMGGMVTFKESIDHWIYKKKQSRFSNDIVGVDGLKNKIKQANG